MPTNMVQQAVPELIASGDYTYPWLGIEGRDLFPADVVAVDLPVRQGALVITVTQDSQADAPT